LAKFDNKVRVEGIGEYKIGRLRISYVDRNEASDYVGKYVIKPITLEDLFIIYGGESLEE